MSFEKNVFINCPFDITYINDLLKPMLYVIIKNGYFPHLTLEIADSGQLRLEKITELLKTVDMAFTIYQSLNLRKPKNSQE